MPGHALINDASENRCFIFANLLKCATIAGPRTNATYAWQAFLDSNGYPNNAPGNQLSDDVKYTFSIPPAWGTATLVASWSGTGAFYLQPAAVSNLTVTNGTSVVNSSSLPTFIKVTGTNVRLTFNFTSAPVDDTTSNTYLGYFLASTIYSGFSKLVLCRQTDEAVVIVNENALNPDYVAALRALNPRTYRALGISGVDGGNQSQFSQRAPATAFSFFADRYPPECWTSAASGNGSGGTPYVASMPSGMSGLVDGATVQLQFTSANTTTQPVINVGGTGNVRITDLGPSDLGIGAIAAGSVWTLTYSALYNYWTGRNATVNGGVVAKQAGILWQVPLEQHIAIANAVNCNLWYNICHRMTPSQGTSIANTVLVNLNSNLAFYPEFSNEVWNAAGSIGLNTSFVQNIGVTLGVTTANNEHTHFGYGLLLRQMMGTITAAWGGPNSRLRRVMAIQAYGNNGLTQDVNKYRLKGTDIATTANGGAVANSGPINTLYTNVYGAPNYTSFPDRPIDYCDVIAYATYYAGGQLLQVDAPNAGYQHIVNAKNITGISQDATGGVLTYGSDPGYATGYRVKIQSVAGMVQINNSNVTLSKLTATTYKMFTDSSLGTGFDTSGFSAYTGPSGTSSQYPIISGLTAWADLYATGTAANITSAFNSLDTDIRAGSQYNSSGVLSQTGVQTLLDLSTNSNVYPGWEAVAASYDGARPTGTLNLTIECYEGAFAGLPLSSTTCTLLGINTGYATSIQNLMFNYKLDNRFQILVRDQFTQFMASGPHAVAPAWFQIVGYGGPWALTALDLYTLPTSIGGLFSGSQYTSWYGVALYNSNKRRFIVKVA